jgi:sporulation protein YlmC with PRC-barrel domain
MKQKLKIIGGASAVSLCALAVLAQNTFAPNSQNSLSQPTTTGAAISVRAEQTGPATRASDIVGAPVRNHQDEKLGKVDHLDLDLASGRITQVIISSGGFAGMGNRLHAVQPQSLQYNASEKVVYLEASAEQLKAMPEWNESTHSEAQDSSQASARENSYTYQSRPADASMHAKVIPSDADNTRSVRTSDGRWQTKQGGNDDQNISSSARYNSNSSSSSALKSDENTSVRAGMESSSSTRSDSRSRPTDANLAADSSSSADATQNSSKLVGKAVRNMQDEKLGKVEDLILDLSAGRIVAVVVSSGGFLGIDNELSAIPPTAFHYSAQQNVLQLDVSKETLANATHFRADQWPDLNQANAIRVDSFTGGNTGGTSQNVRERGSRNSQTNSINNGQQQYQPQP